MVSKLIENKTLIGLAAGVALITGSVAGVAFGAAFGTEQAGGIAQVGFKIQRKPLVRSLETAQQRQDYREAYVKAKKLHLDPAQSTLGSDVSLRVARAKTDALEVKIKKAQKPEFPAPESLGVSAATLNSIASCESGGNPAAVDSSGTYRGKYQFDLGTWASVGGSGDPAAASEAEQDYRAALLYSRSGSSPWPICGS